MVQCHLPWYKRTNHQGNNRGSRFLQNVNTWSTTLHSATSQKTLDLHSYCCMNLKPHNKQCQY